MGASEKERSLHRLVLKLQSSRRDWRVKYEALEKAVVEALNENEDERDTHWFKALAKSVDYAEEPSEADRRYREDQVAIDAHDDRREAEGKRVAS